MFFLSISKIHLLLFKLNYHKRDNFTFKVYWCWSFLNELVSSQIVCKLVLKQDNSPSFFVAVKVFGRSVKSLVSAEPQLIRRWGWVNNDPHVARVRREERKTLATNHLLVLQKKQMTHIGGEKKLLQQINSWSGNSCKKGK